MDLLTFLSDVSKFSIAHVFLSIYFADTADEKETHPEYWDAWKLDSLLLFFVFGLNHHPYY